MGGLKRQSVPQATVLFAEQLIVGGVVSTTVTVWLQVLVLSHKSMTCHSRVMINSQDVPLVTVSSTVMVMSGPSQGSSAGVGGSKSQAVPHSTIISVGQTTAFA